MTTANTQKIIQQIAKANRIGSLGMDDLIERVPEAFDADSEAAILALDEIERAAQAITSALRRHWRCSKATLNNADAAMKIECAHFIRNAAHRLGSHPNRVTDAWMPVVYGSTAHVHPEVCQRLRDELAA